ncbi:MAG: HAD family acid phosphatase [Eubacteriales bacterium]|nr:HAD family acid phosphatase [Eubacteriales bacterium]
MMRYFGKRALISLFALVVVMTGLTTGTASAAGFSPNPSYEYLVGSTIWQLSGESQALMQQAFTAARGRIAELALRCVDSAQPDWRFEEGPDGTKRMMFQSRPVAIITDVDDTLVDGAHYTADIVGANGDINNVAFARFVLSDGCTALPGAVDFIRFCVERGVEVYYVTNRYDQGYKIGQADSVSSYEAVVGNAGDGRYLALDGTEIGTTIYQALGKSFYDITLETMTKLGFPIDDGHLIVNDSKLNGESKERARQAIEKGCVDYPNGQREECASVGCARTLSCEAHEIVLLLGDQLGDFTDDFVDKDAIARAKSTEEYASKWGVEWIVLPNAVYGSAFNAALGYGVPELFAAYAYTK